MVLARYLKLFVAFGRFSLLNEMAFRANYVAKVAVEILWLFLMIVFYRTLFSQTQAVGGWTEPQYLFFLGCYYALDGLVETLFLSNCSEFAELVRSGNLDFILLKPIDEQFLVSFRNIEWSSAPNVILGFGLMIVGLQRLGWPVGPVQVSVFVVTFACAIVMSYCFLITLASTSVWLVKNQSLFELWWLFTSLMRYPREIFRGPWAGALGWVFSFLLPALLITNVPASTMVKVLDPVLATYMVGATIVLLVVSRRFFRRALQSYRSASS
ncbi:MAG: ABC-2 family transporter protein [Gemmataceae bacterium]